MNNLNAQIKMIPADHEYIQYYGRWDFSNPQTPKHSWPGAYIYCEFEGSTIGVRMNDSTNYYNVYLDNILYKIFKGNTPGDANYIFADNLDYKKHTLRMSKRNILFDEISSFSGIILDTKGNLIVPPQRPTRKIEFTGDSFTTAESNEAKVQSLPWLERIPVTNIDKGFAPLIARHFNAEYSTVCRSGIGMVCDWQGNSEISMLKWYNRTLMESDKPEWDFSKWIPQVVVIALGLNDFSGLKDKTGNVNEQNVLRFNNGYHEFIATVRNNYSGVKILLVAPFVEWLRLNIKKVYDEEYEKGYRDIYYTQYDYFEDGYMANGHPTVETHKKMADQIISFMEEAKLFNSGK